MATQHLGDKKSTYPTTGLYERGPGRSQRIVQNLIAKSKSEYVAPFDIGLICAGLGDDSAAIDWLSRCKTDRDHEGSHMRLDPLLKRLRRNPRFVALTAPTSLDPIHSHASRGEFTGVDRP
jgi:hypothetical protein